MMTPDPTHSTSGTRSRRLRRSRGAVVAMVAAFVLTTTAGVAVGLGAAKVRRYDGAATYYVTDAPEPQVPPEEQAGEVVDVLKVGQLLLQGECIAGIDPITELMTASIVYRVINTGSDPVLVSVPWTDFSTAGPWVWLDPGERDPLFWAGQMAGSDIGTQAMVTPFVVVDEGETTATGVAAWWARTSGADRTATCMFTAQAKG